MREPNEEVCASEDGLLSRGWSMDAQDQRPDTGQGDRVPPLPFSTGASEGFRERPGTPSPGPVEGSLVDLQPITNPVILRRKKLIDRLTAELHGMLMIDSPLSDVEVDLERMMYLRRESVDT